MTTSEHSRPLAQQLAEAQATIDALLAGQIDAVVDSKTHTPILLSKAQAALRESEERYRQIVETSNEAIWTLDDAWTITFANRRLAAMLGYGAGEMVGKSFVEFLPQTAEARTAYLLRLQRSGEGESEESELALVRKDGAELWAVLKTSPIINADGACVGTLAMMTDKTRRKRAEDALRASEERMRFALEAAGVGIWDLDFTTGVLEWSDILKSQYGLTPETFAGTFDGAINGIHPEDRARVIVTMAAAAKSGADFTLHHRALWSDGTVRWLSGAGCIHLDKHGNPLRGVGISMDVTQRHMLEDQYQQAQKMEAIGRLAGGVAHDFNNLLTVILGYCELCLADLGADNASTADVIEIQKAGIRAAGLTRQLLAFSRKQIIEPKLHDLNTIVAGMQPMLERLIGEDVAIVVIPAPASAPVNADGGQLEQIVLNLVVNARDAMPKGGTLTIKISVAETVFTRRSNDVQLKEGPYVVLRVSDTGSGMTAQVQARLFEPFFTTKEVGKGTGLGLATVHGIVGRIGGGVQVRSEVGKGSTFDVYIPKVEGAALVAEAPVVAVRPEMAIETVLVVEDADELRTLARILLERQGFTVLVAANAEEAAQVFEQNASIDVLLTDVVMPGDSGPELSRQLVEKRPSLKVVYMSGYTDDAIVHHGVLKPGIAFLHKPFTSETLGKKIREVLDGP